MSNLTRYDPINELARFDPFMDMDSMFNKFMMRPLSRGGMDIEPQIKMDIKEADGKYMVSAEIPGVKKEDIHVTVDGNRVSISAEVKSEKETKEGERVIRSERSYGMASRSFTLSDEVDSSKVQAKYNNGMLELTLPAHSTPFGHPFQHDPATCSTHIRPRQSERSDARIAG